MWNSRPSGSAGNPREFRRILDFACPKDHPEYIQLTRLRTVIVTRGAYDEFHGNWGECCSVDTVLRDYYDEVLLLKKVLVLVLLLNDCTYIYIYIYAHMTGNHKHARTYSMTPHHLPHTAAAIEVH